MTEPELKQLILQTVHEVVANAAHRAEMECRTRGATATSLQGPYLVCEVALLHFQKALAGEVSKRMPKGGEST